MQPPLVDDCLKWCFTSTKTVGLLGTAQDGHLDFHTADDMRIRYLYGSVTVPGLIGMSNQQPPNALRAKF